MAGRVYTSRRLAHVCQVRSGGDLLLLLLACSRWLPIFVIVSYSIFIAVQCPWLEVDPGPGTGFEVGISVVGLCALGEPLSMNDFFFYFHFFPSLWWLLFVVLVLLRLLLLVEQTNW